MAKKGSWRPKQFNTELNKYVNNENNYAYYWSYRFYYDLLMNIVINRFKWNGIPSTVNERYLELMLTERGAAAYFNDPAIGELALPIQEQGPLDIYMEPINPIAYASNGQYQRQLHSYVSEDDPGDCVIIHNNRMHSPSIYYINRYAMMLAEADQVTKVNLNAQRNPFILAVDESQKISADIIVNKINRGERVIVLATNGGIEPGDIQVLTTAAEYHVSDLYAYKKNLWNEALNSFGITTLASDKRERTITGEMEANNQSILSQRNIYLVERQIAAEAITKMFGHEVTVEYRGDDIDNILLSMGGVPNGPVYNDAGGNAGTGMEPTAG